MSNVDDDLYALTRPGSSSARLAAYQRRKMFRAFLRKTGVQPGDTILDIGATSDQSLSHSNYVEAWYPHKDKITATGIDDASFLEKMYTGIKFVLTDGKSLPFPDQSFDFVHSSAVLEHVGSRENQLQFLIEGWRVTRKGFFLTTPNRWFPIELHTALPMLHWLPAPFYRYLLGKTKMRYFALEEHLNLLSANDLRRLACKAEMVNPEIFGARLGGWPCNLLLFARRTG